VELQYSGMFRAARPKAAKSKSGSTTTSPKRLSKAEDSKGRHDATVFLERGFRFFFYSNEGSPREPLHIHVEKDNLEAKFWLIPEVRVAYNDG